jgi:hypothetical protein
VPQRTVEECVPPTGWHAHTACPEGGDDEWQREGARRTLPYRMQLRRSYGEVVLVHEGWTLIRYLYDGGVGIALPPAACTSRAVVRRLRVVLPPGWTVRYRRGRRARFLYRGIYGWTVRLLTFYPTGEVSLGNGSLTKAELDAEADRRLHITGVDDITSIEEDDDG